MAKKTLAQQELDEFNVVFKALAHATRRHILVVLRSRGGEIPAGEIAAGFAHKWPTITRHMQKLEKAGLVKLKRSGTNQLYSLNSEKLTRVVKNFIKWF